MAYDRDLANRVREQLADETRVTEQAMFGGLAIMLAGNMAVGVLGDDLIVRVGRDAYEDALERPHTRVFDATGRPMTGWVLVEPAGTRTARQLGGWVRRGAEFALTLPPKG